MLNKYLTMDPVPWLTDGENPAVTYLVKNEIIKNRIIMKYMRNL